MMSIMSYIAALALVLLSFVGEVSAQLVIEEAPQNVIALHGSRVVIKFATVNHQDCTVSINSESTNGENFEIITDGKPKIYKNDADREKLSAFRDVLVNHTDLRRCDVTIPFMVPHFAGLISFFYQVGTSPRAVYVAYLEKGPECTSGRDTEDQHHASNRTLLTCSLVASADIQHGLELHWNYRDGTRVEKSQTTSCSGICNSVSAGRNYILTSQVELISTVDGLASVTCSVVLNVALLEIKDDIDTNPAKLATNCSTRHYPIVKSVHIKENIPNQKDEDFGNKEFYSDPKIVPLFITILFVTFLTFISVHIACIKKTSQRFLNWIRIKFGSSKVKAYTSPTQVVDNDIPDSFLLDAQTEDSKKGEQSRLDEQTSLDLATQNQDYGNCNVNLKGIRI